jgi:hypothetical protein
MPYVNIGPNKFDCHVCETRCDGKTVSQFDFERDVNFSEAIEKELIEKINHNYPNLNAAKTTRDGYPDIEIKNWNNITVCLSLIEIKVQARTFMSIQKHLPNSGLYPSETLACNLSDMERYFKIKDREQIPIFVTWCLMNRPCVTGLFQENKNFYSQEIDVLREIRLNDRFNYRRFRRASGRGDIVNGQHRGVVVNYHFSLNEFNKGLPVLKSLNS